jgi:hypothetical protein
MRLHLWTSIEAEEHLTGPAELLRSSYFGELILTPDVLDRLHAAAVAPIRARWLPEVHQPISAERQIRRALGEEDAWSHLADMAATLHASAAAVLSAASGEGDLKPSVERFALQANTTAAALSGIRPALGTSDWDSLRASLGTRTPVSREWSLLVRQLRARRSSLALQATNTLADLQAAAKGLSALSQELNWALVAVVADAGYGKTQLSAQLTASNGSRPAGVLLHGRYLQAGGTLDDLAQRVAPFGTPLASFESLIAAVDAAGQRAGRRLPIVIDGLNEAEDPRDWKPGLASLSVQLQLYPHVLVVCTVRSAFVDEAVPEDVRRVTIPGFEEDLVSAVRTYFTHYRIDPADADLPWRLLSHPLTLRMFCEAPIRIGRAQSESKRCPLR